MMNEKIIILDFGSQYTQLIARKIREVGVYAEIKPFNITVQEIQSLSPSGIILSGGPSSVYNSDSPQLDPQIFKMDIPILGICYGLQLIAYHLGGVVDSSARREYGRAILRIDKPNRLLEGLSSNQVWMSHGDSLSAIPDGFSVIAHTDNSLFAAIESNDGKIYGVQFHPEVHHTTDGKKILENFVRNICGINDIWSAGSFIEREVQEIRNKVNNEEVLCAVSGGVDSTVLAVLMNNAIGANLHCVHIDTGLMRTNESQELAKLFRENFAIPLDVIDASEEFLEALAGIADPEKKRKIIGNKFIEVFERFAMQFPNVKWLAQGTLYPDVIESGSVFGPSATIKSHHNVGGLPEKMNLKIIEPFRNLFKDEVRAIGKELNIPDNFLGRHPFPGPGLAIRIIGDVKREQLEILRKADDIFIEEIRNNELYDIIWQAFAVLLPTQSVGVMGDERTYENTLALRAVRSVDGMTADWYNFDYEILAKISSRIINEVKGVNRVVYDITSKPPGTIEWE
jgi:GMP synthase (glutamine-hydrolysing)